MALTVLLLVLVGTSVSHSQTNAIKGGGQVTLGTPIKPWGNWKALDPKFPYLEDRVQCEAETQEKGRAVSIWDYEIRSRYQRTIDYAYAVELASLTTQREHVSVTFLETGVRIGDTYPNYTVMFGGCSQHMTPATGVHFVVKCLVSTGERCLSNGQPVLADSSDTVAVAFPDVAAKKGASSYSSSVATTENGASVASPESSITNFYGYCYQGVWGAGLGRYNSITVFSRVFQTTCAAGTEQPIGAQAPGMYEGSCNEDALKRFQQFIANLYLDQEGRKLQTGSSCIFFSSSDQARQFLRTLERGDYKEIDWTSN
jgi:hypothetical protein